MSSIDDCLNVRILCRQELAADIIGLELVAEDGQDLPAFEAGAHVDLHVAPGLVRQYSLCNAPGERHRYRLGILRDAASRGGSEQVHRDFSEGQVVRISRPRCNFRLSPHASRTILLAGGIGITPLMSMAHQLQDDGREFSLHYCTRNHERTAFADELRACGFADRVRLHHDDGEPAQRFSLETALAAADSGVHLYVCGPTGFISFVTAGARALGWSDDRIHVEHFGAEVSTAGATFSVLANRSGVTVDVEEGQTIAQALLAAGIAVPLSCEQGVCGSCLTRVLDGVPDHRDMYQTDQEKESNTYITPCCSRSLGPRLVLDL